mmetsp:Transcript_38419/g.85780  ORF Transcript_38419/g.85780 Transcript_38419/m.85780 type:complete len:132 (+) Transcript_38419:81-476(+)
MGTGVVSAYKVLARYADLVQLRWDEDCCWVHSLFARFLLESRKNRQYESCYLDVARPFNSTRCGVMPHISSLSVVDTSRPMGHDKYATNWPSSESTPRPSAPPPANRPEPERPPPRLERGRAPSLSRTQPE